MTTTRPPLSRRNAHSRPLPPDPFTHERTRRLRSSPGNRIKDYPTSPESKKEAGSGTSKKNKGSGLALAAFAAAVVALLSGLLESRTVELVKAVRS